MNGGPSQMDLFDYKPKMDAMFDKDLPDSIRKGQRLTTMTSGQARFPIAPSKYKFARHGQSGMWVSELLPWTARIVDEIALVKTVWTEAINHDPAVTYICTGQPASGPAQPGLVAQLRPGDDEPEPAGLRGDDRVVVEQATRPGDLQPALGRRLPAHQAPGRGPPLDRRPGPFPLQPRRGRRRHPPARARRHQPPEPPRIRAVRRPRDARPASPSTRWPSGCRRRSPS